jgi:hypothetical protein
MYFEDVEQGYRRVARAPENPVRIQAELDVLGIGRDQHMVKLASRVAQLHVVIVIGQHQPLGGERRSELVESGSLEPDWAVLLADRPAIG